VLRETVVGARGFEPPTPWSQTRCATRLRYAPLLLRALKTYPLAGLLASPNRARYFFLAGGALTVGTGSSSAAPDDGVLPPAQPK
jgi:hypothetical protein